MFKKIRKWFSFFHVVIATSHFLVITTIITLVITSNWTVDITKIVQNRNLGTIYIGQKDLPNTSEILQAIQKQNPKSAARLNTNNFKLTDITKTEAKIFLKTNPAKVMTINFNCKNWKKLKNNTVKQTKINHILKTNTTTYIATDNDVYYYNEQKKQYQLLIKNIKTSALTESDNISYLTGDKNIYQIVGLKLQKIAANDLDDIITCSLVIDKNNIYVGTNSGNVYRLTANNFKKIGCFNNKITNLVKSKNKAAIYVGTNNDLFIIKAMQTAKSIKPFSLITTTNEFISSFIIDENDHYYITTNKGKVFHSLDGHDYRLFVNITETISTLIAAKKEKIYAANDNKIYRIEYNKFIDITTEISGIITSLVKTKAGDLIISNQIGSITNILISEVK